MNIQFETQYPSGCYWCADLNGDGTVNNFDTSPFMGLLSTGGTAITYTWDGENRLIGVSPARTPETGDLKIEFKYDYLGRRVEKAVYDANGSGGWEVTPTETRRFMYDDWRMVLELEGGAGVPPANEVVRQYTWGLDLSGSRGGAGGIGGLLGVYDAGEEDEYIYFHDAQGNVGQVVGWVDDFGGASGSAWDANRLVACYEYAPYGEILASTGDFAAVNPFRFSTKYHDDETGLIDFGRRLYDTLQGRWINRDPIEELGGENLYVYVGNNTVSAVDPNGLLTFGPFWCPIRDVIELLYLTQPCPAAEADPDDDECTKKLKEAIQSDSTLNAYCNKAEIGGFLLIRCCEGEMDHIHCFPGEGAIACILPSVVAQGGGELVEAVVEELVHARQCQTGRIGSEYRDFEQCVEMETEAKSQALRVRYPEFPEERIQGLAKLAAKLQCQEVFRRRQQP
ncbi:MAG: RHS repeat-associated core domain-containing protein [Phycisphaerae bacterium]|jgi:RHS repeat-associated protein